MSITAPAPAPARQLDAMVSAVDLAERLGSGIPTREQAAVIESDLGPRAVLAGAGSGKTQTMGLRVAWLVANGFVDPARVLGLTFTRKAAGELNARIRRLLRALVAADSRDPFLVDDVRLALAGGDPTVSTYHGYAATLVAEHGLRIGIEPSTRLLGEAMRWQYAAEVVGSYDGPMSAVDRAPSTVTLDVLTLSGELAEHLRSTADITACADRLRARIDGLAGGGTAKVPAPVRDLVRQLEAQRQLLPLVTRLERRKRDRSVLDFGDQVSLAAALVGRCPEVGVGERERFGVVLLDEYQDTGEAQRRLLATVFAGAPVVAVGDPRQSIYGWRGASAGNLERFPQDFPTHGGNAGPGVGVGDGVDAGVGIDVGAGVDGETPVSSLTVSFRNGAGILSVANRIAEDIPIRGRAPDPLEPGPGREGRGRVLAGLLLTQPDEASWIATSIAELGPKVGWGAIAVLARRRTALPVLEAALRERGVPCEVVGLGGLLLEPEVADVVATLRVLADPSAGNALLRLLTGPRWRLGPRDLRALARRASQLSLGPDTGGPESTVRPETSADAQPLVTASETRSRIPVSIVEALDDLGGAGPFSVPARPRLLALRDELRMLRREVGTPLPELVSAVIRTLRLDVELSSRPGVRPVDATAGLARFVGEAEDFAEHARAEREGRSADGGLAAFLAYLTAAEEQERGLEREAPDPATDRVQLLTVHAAKGLEWDAVYVSGMTEKVFPATGQPVGDWTRQAAALPFPLRGDRDDLPELDLSRWTDLKAAAAEIKEFQQRCRDRALVEERRLAYVAVTRARELLVCSGYWWDSASKPRGPSMFLQEIRDVATSGLLEVEAESVGPWEAPPPDDAVNPLTTVKGELRWPSAALVNADLATAAHRVTVLREQPGFGGADAADTADTADSQGSPDPWAEEVELLLAERRRRADRHRTVELPARLSVSALMSLRRDPDEYARTLRRPLPQQPRPLARRGTRFHSWLEQLWGQQRLLDLDELPGAADESADLDDDLTRLQTAFAASEWYDRHPAEIEFPFELPLAGIVVRGRIDAVFTDSADGLVDIVDWKTGAVPAQAELGAASVQLAAYRLAWHALTDTPLSSIRAAFHYVGPNRTVRPTDLLDADQLAGLVREVPLAMEGSSASSPPDGQDH